jgi:hypothetical protein
MGLGLCERSIFVGLGLELQAFYYKARTQLNGLGRFELHKFMRISISYPSKRVTVRPSLYLAWNGITKAHPNDAKISLFCVAGVGINLVFFFQTATMAFHVNIIIILKPFLA